MNAQTAFPIESILSVTTGVAFIEEIGDLYEILNYLTGDVLRMRQLSRAGRVCKSAILFQHPRLADVDASHVNEENWAQFVRECKERYGDALPLQPVTDWQSRDPINKIIEQVIADIAAANG